MKNKIGLLILATTLSNSVFAQHDPCQTLFGSQICEHGIVNNISGTYTGLIVDNMQVTGLIKGTYAGMDIHSSKIKSIYATIAGLNIDDSTIEDDITGKIAALYAEDSFLKNIYAKAQEIKLNQTQINNISASNNDKTSIKITLENYTLVKGDITFSPNYGKLCIDETSKVIGNVINGEILKTCEDNE